MFDVRLARLRHGLARPWHGQNLGTQALGTVSRPFSPAPEERRVFPRSSISVFQGGALLSSSCYLLAAIFVTICGPILEVVTVVTSPINIGLGPPLRTMQNRSVTTSKIIK